MTGTTPVSLSILNGVQMELGRYARDKTAANWEALESAIRNALPGQEVTQEALETLRSSCDWLAEWLRLNVSCCPLSSR